MPITPPRPRALAAFARFVLCGGGVGLASSGALVLLADRMSVAVANALVTVVSTLVATELHGRVTFRSGQAGWGRHGVSAVTVAVCYLFTTAALVGLRAVEPDPGALLEQSVYLAASGLAGIGRFLVLRTVFPARTVEAVLSRGAVVAAA